MRIWFVLAAILVTNTHATGAEEIVGTCLIHVVLSLGMAYFAFKAGWLRGRVLTDALEVRVKECHVMLDERARLLGRVFAELQLERQRVAVFEDALQQMKKGK